MAVSEVALAAPEDGAFAPVACPTSLTAIADCREARDANGAFVLVALPRDWNRKLVVHAHGGPRLRPPVAGDSTDDLDRYAALVRAGYAWVGSTYRRAGYGVRRAAADVEHSRQLFVQHWGQPSRTWLHGQSWGGNVAAKLAELYALDVNGQRNYDGVLTTNGVLFGGTAAYGFRADLRVVYQAYCHNHPAPDEPAYPLWQGLPAGAKLTREQLAQRVDDCTGLTLSPDQRSSEQAGRLRNILAVTGIAEPQLLSHLNWATFHFQDLVQRHLRGHNPFDNRHTVYLGSDDDALLNATVERFDADPQAVARLAYDADLSGQIVLPTVNLHASGDPTVSPLALQAYSRTVALAGRSDLLQQRLIDGHDHSRLPDAAYLWGLAALEQSVP